MVTVYRVYHVDEETGSGGRGRVETAIAEFSTMEQAKTFHLAKQKEEGYIYEQFIRAEEKTAPTTVITKTREELKEDIRRREGDTGVREDYAEALEKRREIIAANIKKTYGETAAERYLERTEPVYKTIIEPEKPEVKIAYGGVTKDATPEQIAKARAEGGEYYYGGVKYTFGGDRFTRSDVMASIYGKMGYDTSIIGSIFYAAKPREQIAISPTEDILKVKGEVTYPTALRFYPEFTPIPITVTTKVKSYRTEPSIMEKWAESIAEQEKVLQERYKYIIDFLKITPYTTPLGLPTTKKTFSTELRKELELAAYGMTAGLIQEGVIATQKGMFFAAALFQKDKREAAIRESRRAGTLLLPTLKEQAVEMELFKFTPKGVVTTGILFAAPLIPAIPKLTKKGRAISVLRSVVKQKPPDIKLAQYYGKKRITYGLKAEQIYKTPKIYIKKPSGKVTSRYIVDISKPTVTVAKSITGKTPFKSVTTPDLIQYVTTITKKAGRTYYIRSRILPTGKAITTVYRGDIPLRTFRYKAEPTLKPLEPLPRISKKEYVSMPEFRKQIDTGIDTSGFVSLLEKGKYEIKGLRLRGTQDIIQTVTKKPRTEILGKPIYDFITGKKIIEPISIKIGETRYIYVDYPPKPKPFYTATGDFGIFIKKPTISKTIQTTKIKDISIIRFVKTKKTRTLSDLLKSKRGELITKPKIQIEEIFKPKIKQKLKGDMSLYLPTTKFIIPTTAPLLSFVFAAGISITEPKTEFLPKAEPRDKLISIAEPKTEFLFKIEPKAELISQPKAELISKVRQEVIQEQVLIQEIKPLGKITDTFMDFIRTPITKVPSIKVPPPPFIFDFRLIKRKKELLAAKKEQGYDVMIKRKQEKINKRYKSRGYEKANRVPLTKEAALGLGASLVDRFTNRSFTIKKTKETAVKRIELKQKWKAIKEKFRRAKSRPNVIIEKTKHAIDSIEEKEGIPYEARRLRMLGLINAKKKKKLAGLMKVKVSNSFLNIKKKRKVVKKWL